MTKSALQIARAAYQPNFRKRWKELLRLQKAQLLSLLLTRKKSRNCSPTRTECLWLSLKLPMRWLTSPQWTWVLSFPVDRLLAVTMWFPVFSTVSRSWTKTANCMALFWALAAWLTIIIWNWLLTSLMNTAIRVVWHHRFGPYQAGKGRTVWERLWNPERTRHQGIGYHRWRWLQH